MPRAGMEHGGEWRRAQPGTVSRPAEIADYPRQAANPRIFRSNRRKSRWNRFKSGAGGRRTGGGRLRRSGSPSGDLGSPGPWGPGVIAPGDLAAAPGDLLQPPPRRPCSRPRRPCSRPRRFCSRSPGASAGAPAVIPRGLGLSPKRRQLRLRWNRARYWRGRFRRIWRSGQRSMHALERWRDIMDLRQHMSRWNGKMTKEKWLFCCLSGWCS